MTNGLVLDQRPRPKADSENPAKSDIQQQQAGAQPEMIADLADPERDNGAADDCRAEDPGESAV